MQLRWVTGFFDAPSREGEDFWLAVTGYRLSPRRGEFATLLPDGADAYLRTQVVGDGPARMHLDLHVDDVAATRRRLMDLGAVAVSDLTLRSPAGLLLCVVPWRGERFRSGPSAHGSVVDQVCLDVPAASFEAEADFWVAATGFEGRPGSRPEFFVLVRPEEFPIRVMLQRVGAGPAGMHADLAAVDRESEVRRHLGLGASFVREGHGWTTLRDPAGREYCVTGREPGST